MKWFVPKTREYEPDDFCDSCGADVYYVGKLVYCGNCDRPELMCGCPDDPDKKEG